MPVSGQPLDVPAPIDHPAPRGLVVRDLPNPGLAAPVETAEPDALPVGIPAAPDHRSVLSAISGLLVGLFVALISTTVITPSLPTIVADLGGTQSGLTWIITASLLAMTVATPIWGKLADLVNRKRLVLAALSIFAIGSVLSGLAPSTGWLIGSRLLQGLGIGGLLGLTQIVIADLVSPRDRGKYMGLVGAVIGVGQIGGPLVGGLITDTVGWRWNFFVFVPFAVISLAMIQRTLRLPPRPPREVSIDYAGAALIAVGVSLLLIWVSLGGEVFGWWSVPALGLLGGSVALLTAAVVVEARAAEPIIPLRLFADRTFTLAVIGSMALGVAMIGTSIYLSQYMQMARGATPTQSGLMILPMIIGQMSGGIGSGQLITRFGRWKRYMVAGSVITTTALALLGSIHYDASFVEVAAAMALLGLGVGMLMQNFVLVVQNSIAARHTGAATAGVSFFRTLGGTIGVSALGAYLAHRVPVLMAAGLAGLPAADRAAAAALEDGAIPDMSSLPAALRQVVEGAYGDGIASLFLRAVPFGLVVLATVIALPNKQLGRLTGAQQAVAEAAAGVGRGDPAGQVDPARSAD